jgi:type IV pilus assembly protein PilW
MRNNMTRKQILSGSKQQGFSLVEIMVGLAIGLIGTIVIFQVFSISEGQKRTTTAGNDANQNGIFAIYTLERHLRVSGGGLIGNSTLGQNIIGCAVQATFGAAQVLPAAGFPAPFNTLNGAVTAAPILIQDGGGFVPDKIITMYGNSSTAGVPFIITSGNGTSMDLGNTVGMGQGDVLLSMNETPRTLAPGTQNCTISQITNVPTANGTLSLQAGLTFRNSATGITGNNLTGINLGQPGLIGFAINSPAADRFELVSYDFLTGGPVAPVADNVVNLQALYGVDNGNGGTAGDSVIDQWVPATGAWSYATLNNGSVASATALRQIKAIQLGVITRSSLPEKPNAQGIPITTQNPVLFLDRGAALAVTMDLTQTAGAQNYRYKTFETIIPLRNMLIYQCSLNDRAQGLCS